MFPVSDAMIELANAWKLEALALKNQADEAAKHTPVYSAELRGRAESLDRCAGFLISAVQMAAAHRDSN